MLDRRSQGLLTLHGCIVFLALNLLFVFQAVVGVEFTDRYRYDLINFPLYLIGISACGLIYFNFYSLLAAGMFQKGQARIFQVTNLQIAVMLVMLFGIIFATKDQAISRTFLGTYLVLSYVLLFFLNYKLPRVISQLLFKGGNLRRCLVIGKPDSYERIREWLVTKKNLGMEVIGLVDPGSHGSESVGAPFIGKISQLSELVVRHEVNQLILLETRQSKAWVRQVMQTAEEQGCQFMIYNPWAEYFEQPLTSMKDGPHTFFIPRQEPLESPFNRILKRFIDLTLAIPLLLFVLPPLTLWVYFKQRQESPGPIFFRQQRRGYNKAIFTIYKFRTMHEANDDEARQATQSDPRVFKFGQFLRRTSLDELPQFWNVLKGQMSVVGPRPHLPEHDELFSQTVPVYPQRHFVKPGITGHAQCQGLRGEITTPELIRQRVHYDLEYITEWSLWMDFEIMVRTVLILLRPPDSAY